MALRVACLAVGIWGTLSNAIPAVSFPLNSQVPPVARISEPFSYTFSSSTFFSTLPMTYTLSNAPDWISLDSSTRTLSGTPSESDAGADLVTGVSISITANDQSGSVTLNATIVISKNPPPEITKPLSAQLPSLGTFSSPSTLLYHPSSPFKLNLDPRTFTGGDGSSNFSYYAVTSDNTPLPSWIAFDPTSFSFSGQTPDYASLVQPPQTFGLKLIASDVSGFAGSSVSFDLEVGIHLFAFKNGNMVLNAIPGSQTTFNGLSNNAELDGQVATMSDIASIAVQTPSWLSFDKSTFMLSGIPPPDVAPVNITVTATDIYGDTADAVISVEVPGAIFSTGVAPFNATIGASFSHDLSDYVRNKSDIEMLLLFSPSIPWANFDTQTFILSGDVPSNLHPMEVNITLQATSTSSQTTSSNFVELSIISADSTPTTSSAPSIGISPNANTSDPTSATVVPGPVQAAAQRSLTKAGTVAAIVVPTILALLIILTLLSFLCYRKRRAERNEYNSSPNIDASEPIKHDSSMEELKLAPRVVLPPPLQLDTSGFGMSNRSSAYSDRRSGISNPDRSIKRSQTVSGALMTGARRPDTAGTAGTAGTLGTRSRAYSEATISKPDTPNWKIAQESSYPTIETRSRSRTNSNASGRISRTYSNYSRKGHTRRTARVWTPDPALRDISNSVQVAEQSKILNLDQDFSDTLLERFSTIPKRASISEMLDTGAMSSPIQRTGLSVSRTQRRISKQQRVTSPLERTRTGAGHGGRESISSLTGSERKRRSIGHGQLEEWTTPIAQSHPMSRESKTWLTLGSDETASAHESEDKNHLTTPTETTTIRPISRRIICESPFFSGGAMPDAPTKNPSFRASRGPYTGEPVVLEIETPVADVSLRSSQYGSTKEGTRQLRSYIQDRSRGESRDSRFESASPSMQSVEIIRDTDGGVEVMDEDGYEDFIPDGVSEGSWETSHSPERNSRRDGGNLDGNRDRESRVLSPLRNMELGMNARMVSGRGKRPISHDATKSGSVRGVVERQDSMSSWTAYV